MKGINAQANLKTLPSSFFNFVHFFVNKLSEYNLIDPLSIIHLVTIKKITLPLIVYTILCQLFFASSKIPDKKTTNVPNLYLEPSYRK